MGGLSEVLCSSVAAAVKGGGDDTYERPAKAQWRHFFTDNCPSLASLLLVLPVMYCAAPSVPWDYFIIPDIILIHEIAGSGERKC